MCGTAICSERSYTEAVTLLMMLQRAHPEACSTALSCVWCECLAVMYVLHVIRSAVRYAAKGKTEVEEGGGGGLNISVQLTVVDLGQLVYRSLQCQCTMSRAHLCPEGHLLNLYARSEKRPILRPCVKTSLFSKESL